MSARCKSKIPPDKMRRAGELYLDHHLGYDTIAERLGLGRATIHKAIEQLREERKEQVCRSA